MGVSVARMSRGKGVCYFEITAKGSVDEELQDVRISLSGGWTVPLITLDSKEQISGHERVIRRLVVAPYFEALDYAATATWRDGAGQQRQAETAVSSARLKWMSRIDRSFGKAVRGAEERNRLDHLVVSFERCVPVAGGVVVWFSCLVVQGDNQPQLEVQAVGADGASIEMPVVERMRTYCCQEADRPVPYWKIDYSVQVSDGFGDACLVVHDVTGAHRDGFRVLGRRMRDALAGAFAERTTSAFDDPDYGRWFEKHRANEETLAFQRSDRLSVAPLISVVVPLFNTPLDFFQDLYDSVQAQTYGNWELVLVNASPDNENICKALDAVTDKRVVVVTLEENRGIAGNTWCGIRAAHGAYLAFLDHDDFIEPDALYEYVWAIGQGDYDLLYCDEDGWSRAEGFCRPHFKTDFNRDLLYSHNYITHFLMIRADLVHRAGPSPAYVEGAQDYDLTLRAIELTDRIAHIPRVLYHWRIHDDSTSVNAASKSYAWEAGRRALQDHFDRRGIKAKVARGPELFTHRVEYELKEHPLVSIVIPNKDHLGELQPCVESILQRATYDNFEVIIVENNSVDPATFAYYDAIVRDDRVKVVRYGDWFNYSKVVNYGVAEAAGDYVLLLNNDTEVITPCFIERLLGRFCREEVGVVGAKLLFADDTVQHAGVAVDGAWGPWHEFVSIYRDSPGYQARAILSQNYSAVTGACQMVKRSVYEEVGGYDESFEVAYNDVDFCMRVREAGYLVVFDADTLLYHKEFTSRGWDADEAARIRVYGELSRFRGRYPSVDVVGDPYSSPHFDKSSQYCALDKQGLE